MEEILNVEIVVPQLEYITHEEYTMSMEREANRKLKAEIKRRKKQKHIPNPRTVMILTSEKGMELLNKAFKEYYDSNL